MDKKLLGLNRWAWVGIAALGVVIFLYVRHHASNVAAANVASAPSPDANATDTASFGGTPPSVDNGSVQSPDNAAILGDILSLFEQSQQQYGDNLAALTGAGVNHGGIGSIGVTGSGQAVFTSPNGQSFTVAPNGYAQPAYIGPSGQLVSPTTYAGLGVDPGPIYGPGSYSAPVTSVDAPAAIGHPAAPVFSPGVDWAAAKASVLGAPVQHGKVYAT